MALQRDDAPESSRPVRILYAVLDPAATFTAIWVRFLSRPAAIVLRFARLARLRACCSGRVPISTQFDALYGMEERFPQFFVRHFEFPIVVLRKRSG